MKHLAVVSRTLPAQAATDGHPDVGDSIKGFLEDPIGVVRLHLAVFEQS
jgi:hypothetical protein